MVNFYKVFLERYFYAVHKSKYSYYDEFRTASSGRASLIYKLEVTISLIERAFKFLTKKYITQDEYSLIMVNKNNYFIQHIEELEGTYLLFTDDYSREKYLDYIVFKSVASFKSRLPFDSENLKKQLKSSSNLIVDHKLMLYDLNKIGYNIKFIGSEKGIVLDFILEQYAYNQLVKVETDDVVIDCGGATGDTALYFYGKGAKKVYVYEFLPSSLKVINQQLLNNGITQDKVEVIQKAIWDKSDQELSYLDRGNASIVDKKGKYSDSIMTLTIDDMVIKKELNRVDFIKMDIEGAEVVALNGAYKCIQKHKPKLAISVYHKNDDLITIPTLIKKMNPNYQLYFDYYTNTGAEAILYAIDKGQLVKKYIIYTPGFDSTNGGSIAMHRLCDLLNSNGYEAFIWQGD
ncbi:FkbM family methyltransferase [Psychromonas sp. KJ10-10]|uniref:FkbM family methyltransferase n=1 Tax=Psychromonas sp. KJ10-10 TaxID=3391823 RepID=UPI0039B3978F